MLARSRRKLSIDQFFAEYGGLPNKYELIDGEAVMMTGGSLRHADVSGNSTMRCVTAYAGPAVDRLTPTWAYESMRLASSIPM